ncbi:MAG: hypothetical protein JXX29_14410 [Deltaproteobacteria bacterium]|nr:hypothetical protein [Deltaproteobacteria bacterium]MBN2672872.1 hypothetical protein [Deltaproteobacteria bacterium]
MKRFNMRNVGIFIVVMSLLSSCGAANKAPSQTDDTASETEFSSVVDTDTKTDEDQLRDTESSVDSANPSEQTEQVTNDAPQQPVEPLVVIPDRVSDHFPIQSSGNDVNMTRTETGEFNLTFKVRPKKRAPESWAGYCWNLNRVEGNKYENLIVNFTSVDKAAELQFKLEQEKDVQQRVLRYPSVAGVKIPLDNYPAVRPEVHRFCLAMEAPNDAEKITVAKVTLKNVIFE